MGIDKYTREHARPKYQIGQVVALNGDQDELAKGYTDSLPLYLITGVQGHVVCRGIWRIERYTYTLTNREYYIEPIEEEEKNLIAIADISDTELSTYYLGNLLELPNRLEAPRC